MSFMKWVSLFVFVIPIQVNVSQAATLPKIELGMGLVGLQYNDYPGSDENHGYLLPLPYVIYRGDKLQLNRKGLTGYFGDWGWGRINISLGAGVPVKSDKNEARKGMDDLLPAFGIGPSLVIDLWQNSKHGVDLTFQVPVRQNVAMNFKEFNNLGWTIRPKLNLNMRQPGVSDYWNFSVGIGPLFAGDKYHQYYYDVPQKFVIASRSRFNSAGGYSGSKLVLSLTQRANDYWFGGFIRYTNLSGAKFNNSPLVKQKNSLMIGFGFAKIFYKKGQVDLASVLSD